MTATAAKKPRLLYIDNLRILLTILVIMHHFAIGYGGPGDWLYNERGPLSDVSEILLMLFLGINQAFFMGFFFMISSYFSPGSIDRKGTGPYLRDRLIRLGIPLLFYVLIINPLSIYLVAQLNGYSGTVVDYLTDYLTHPATWSTGVMWFVFSLLVFTLAYLLWRQISGASSTAVHSERAVPGNVVIAAFALGIGVVTFLVRQWQPVGYTVPGINIQPPHFTQYIAMFTLGLIAYRNNWFEKLTDAQGRVWLIAVIVLVILFPVVVVVGGALEGNLDPFFGGPTWQAFAYAVWEQFMCVAMVITLLVWFRRRLTKQGRVAQALSGAAYATYVFHPLVIVALAVSLRNVQLDMGLKYVLVVPFAVGLAFLVGYGVKRLPVARRIL